MIHQHRGETVTLAAALTFAQCRVAPPWANAVEVHCPSATLEQISLALSPRLFKVFHYDASADEYKDLTAPLLDRNTSKLATLASFATADYLYVGCKDRFRGLAVDVVTVNTEASVMTAEKGQSNGGWVALAIAGNTTIAPAGTTLGQDGLITWTVPTDWQLSRVNGIDAFWVRLIVSAALTATVTLDQIQCLFNDVVNANNETAEGNALMLLRTNNDTQPPKLIEFDKSRFGGIEIISASVTSAANINWLLIH